MQSGNPGLQTFVAKLTIGNKRLSAKNYCCKIDNWKQETFSQKLLLQNLQLETRDFQPKTIVAKFAIGKSRLSSKTNSHDQIVLPLTKLRLCRVDFEDMAAVLDQNTNINVDKYYSSALRCHYH